jgi:GPH family glycoside/pentoside/hexuronide:cation symporter
MTTHESGRVPGLTKVLYGLGEIAITTHIVLFGLFVLFFYNSVLGLPALWVGIASAAGLIWDAVLDPYIGYRSDVSPSRFGRRQPYMLAGTLSMGLCFFLIWGPPQGLSRVTLFAWLLVSMLLFRFTSALFRIPYLSLGAELSDDYHERTSIVGYRSFFGLLGALAAGSLSFYFFFPGAGEAVDGKLAYDGYPRMGVAFGVVMTLTAAAALVGTWAHRATADAGEQKRLSSFFASFRVALENASFRRVWISFSLFFVAMVLNGVVSVHFLTWYVKLTEASVLSRLQALFYVSALAGVAFWVVMARRAEKKTLYVVATLTTALLMGSSPLLFGEGHPFGTGDSRAAFVLYGLAGFFASALWIIPASMIADVADEDAVRSGVRREGLFFGILNFGEKVAAGAAVLIGGALIDLVAGLVPGQAEQTDETISRIAWIYGMAPALLLLAAVVAVLGYPLDRDAVARIQLRLRQDASRASPAP